MKKKKQNKSHIWGGYWIGAGILIIFATLLFRASQQPGQYDELAHCLADKGVQFYATWWCPHCSDQKRLFGKSMSVLFDRGVYIECGGAQTGSFRATCSSQGINSVPTWVFPDDEKLVGLQQIESIRIKAEC